MPELYPEHREVHFILSFGIAAGGFPIGIILLELCAEVKGLPQAASLPFFACGASRCYAMELVLRRRFWFS